MLKMNYLKPEQAGMFENFYKPISHYEQLSQAQVCDLINLYRNTGDKKTLDRVVMSQMRYVLHLVKQYAGYVTDISELVEEAKYGLLKAIKRFNPSKSSSFTSFATTWILKYVTDFIIKYTTAFSHCDEKELILDMDATYMTGEEVYVEVDALPSVDSLSRQIDDDDDSYTLEETIGEHDTTIDDDFRRMECRKALELGLKQLTEREALIFRLCNGFGCKKEKCATIAKMLNIKSPERVIQINGNIMRKLASIIDPSVLD